MNCTSWKVAEPRIDDVFADPIIRMMMDKDGVSERMLRDHLDDALTRWKRIELPPAGAETP